MPAILKAFILMLVVFFILVAMAYFRVKNHIDVINNVSALPITYAVSGVPATTGGERSAQTGGGGAPVILPTLSDISACLASSSKCTCYNSHGVPVRISESECRESANNPTDRFNFDTPPSRAGDFRLSSEKHSDNNLISNQ